MSSAIRWTHEDMIDATVEHWGNDSIDAADCKVIAWESGGEQCLVVCHVPTGRTSDEAGDGGRWTHDGVAWNERDAVGPLIAR